MSKTDTAPEVVEFRRLVAQTTRVAGECHRVIDVAIGTVASRVAKKQAKNAERLHELVAWLDDEQEPEVEVVEQEMDLAEISEAEACCPK